MAQRAAATPLDRVGELLGEVGIAPTVERARERSEELVRALVAFYGEGLERVLEIVHDAAGDRSQAVFAALCENAFVESLLALHGLHPLSLEDRVRAALDSIRPYLASHEGEVELVRVADDIAYVRLAGSCEGCHASAATLKNAVETAILERVGEIREVRALAAGDAPSSAHSLEISGYAGAGEIGASRHTLKLQSDWITLADLPELRAASLAHVSCAETPVLLISRESTMFAYRDQCPTCTRALTDAELEWPYVRCAACGERFDVVRAGRVRDGGARSAEPFPLVSDGERVRVVIPLSV